MRVKKIFIIVIMSLFIIFTGCSEKDNSPEVLWNKYIQAMNDKSIEKVAEIYYAKDSTAYNRFIDDNDSSVLFDFDEVKTDAFEDRVINKKYYSAFVKITFVRNNATEQKEFYIHFSRNIVNEWRFTNEVDITNANPELLGNLPDRNFYTNVILSNENFDYKYIYAQQAGEKSDDDFIKIVHPTSNATKLIIPDYIDGTPVEVIGDYAFFEYLKILSVTFSTSKLQEVTLPSNLRIIENYAFYQTKNLKLINLPSSLELVGKYAFASSGLEVIHINVDESAMYASENVVYLSGVDSMRINGNKTVYIGDSVFYSVSGALVDWTVSDESVAAMQTTGRLDLFAPGVITLTATNRADKSLYSEVIITVKAADERHKVSDFNDEDISFSIRKEWFVNEIDNLSVKNGTATWSSSNDNVATIDETGRFTAVAPGTVTITATSTTDPTIFSTATVEVFPVANRSVVTTYHGYTPIEINGAKRLYVGDNIVLTAKGYEEGQVIWSTTNANIASMTTYSGIIFANNPGTATMRVTQASNPNIFSTVAINVGEVKPLLMFAENSLDRLNNLKTIYLNAINPYSVEFKGHLKLSSDTIIYVPAQNFESYKRVLSDYERQLRVNPNF